MSKESEIGLSIRRAELSEAQMIIDFVNSHFDMRLEMINDPEYFNYYYVGDDGLQFVVAEVNGEYKAVCGYIKANRCGTHIWASVLAADDSYKGAGLQLLSAMKDVTGASMIAANNIRKKTAVLYTFLGWHADRISHFYRPADKASYSLLNLNGNSQIPPVDSGGILKKIDDIRETDALAFIPSGCVPSKDAWYIKRRYFGFPKGKYDVYMLVDDKLPSAILVFRIIPASDTGSVPVLRLVDYIGDEKYLPSAGAEIQRLMDESDAEYVDCYCAGISPEIMKKTGFCERTEGDGTIVPNYLSPPLIENTEYYYYTSEPEGFVLFKADGDQDRPR